MKGTTTKLNVGGFTGSTPMRVLVIRRSTGVASLLKNGIGSGRFPLVSMNVTTSRVILTTRDRNLNSYVLN